MNYKNMTAPCGLDCFNCPAFLSSSDKEIRKAIKEQAESLSMNINYGKPYCPGCRNEEGKISFHNMITPCNVYKCITNKGIDFCYECKDFPCDHLHPLADKAQVVPHNTKVFNLCLIKKMGLEKWAEEKAANVKKTYFRDKWNLTDGCSK